MSLLIESGAAVLLLGILVTVHEFGHFIAAKAFGVAVPVFSVGWGPRAFGVVWRGTDYRVSWFPLGGYMRPAGADQFAEGGLSLDPPGLRDDQKFMNKPPWQRAAIKAAGPAMNLILPFGVFAVLFLLGEPQPRSEVLAVTPDSVAAVAGIEPLDTVVGVNGEAVTTWVDVIEAFHRAPSDPVVIEVLHGAERREVTLDKEGAAKLPLDPISYGMSPYAPDASIVVDHPVSPAALAQLQTGDVITRVGDARITNLPRLRAALVAAEGPTTVVYERGGVEATTTITPEDGWNARPTAADDALWQRTGIASANLGIDSFADKSAGRTAGLLVGDRVLQVNDQVVRSWMDVTREVQKSAEGEGAAAITHPLTMTVRRHGGIESFTITPEVVHDSDDYGRYYWRAMVGIGFGGSTVEPESVKRPYGPAESLRRSSEQVSGVATSIVSQIGKLATLQADPYKTLGGPVEMFRQTRQAASKGAFEWAQLLGLLSISLGIVNLLPVPVFDGGDLLIYLAEWIRGRALPQALRERAQQFGVIFITLLMLSVIVMDVHRWLIG